MYPPFVNGSTEQLLIVFESREPLGRQFGKLFRLLSAEIWLPVITPHWYAVE